MANIGNAVENLTEDTKKKVKTNKKEIDADIVIIATGVKPNTDFLNNEEIKMLRNGAIVVDKFGKTSVEDVYSAGDCATINNLITGKEVYVPLATGANKLGRIVGENLAGQENSFQGSMASSCIKVLSVEAARTGLTEKEVKELFAKESVPFKGISCSTDSRGIFDCVRKLRFSVSEPDG